MRTLVLPLFAMPLLAIAVFALDRHLRAMRTRRQVVDALAAVPEVAGVAPLGHGDRVATLARVLGARLDRGERERIGTVARLVPLDPGVVDAAGVGVDVVHLLEEVQKAPVGQAGAAAATVRVAATFESHVGPASGALFATLVRHPRGEERRAAEILVRFAEMRPPRV